MKNQRIVFTAPGVAELVDCPMPEVGANDVRVRVAVSSISSGTERANVSGDPNISYASTDQTVRFPRYGGYSTSGIVDAVGANVKSVKPGDRVAMSWTTHCRTVTVNENNVYLLPTASASKRARSYISRPSRSPLYANARRDRRVGYCHGTGRARTDRDSAAARPPELVPIIAADPNPTCREKAFEIRRGLRARPVRSRFRRDREVIDPRRRQSRDRSHRQRQGARHRARLHGALRQSRAARLHTSFGLHYRLLPQDTRPGITLIGAHTNAVRSMNHRMAGGLSETTRWH